MVQHRGVKYALDPKASVRADYTFVSHAHMDHVETPHPASKVLASKETVTLARARGVELGSERHALPDDVALLDSGHILGARALYIKDEVLYTGDAAGRERAFMSRCKTKKARCPDNGDDLWRPALHLPSAGPDGQARQRDHRPHVRQGEADRPHGVSARQVPDTLVSLLLVVHPFFVHESVGQMNDIYRESGVPLKAAAKTISRTLDGLPQGPWVMIAPMMSARNRVAVRLKKEFGAVLTAFSGWAVERGYGGSMGADYSFPVSDHCDYSELLKLVEDVSPEVVYTTHGFTNEFAMTLRAEGFDAKPLDGYQAALSDYRSDT